MRWIDGHCDVLWKLWNARTRVSFYDPDSSLDVRYPDARKSGIGMQVFAVFVDPQYPKALAWDIALRQVDTCFMRRSFVMAAT